MICFRIDVKEETRSLRGRGSADIMECNRISEQAITEGSKETYKQTYKQKIEGRVYGEI
jgi:hypothetical protein